MVVVTLPSSFIMMPCLTPVKGPVGADSEQSPSVNDLSVADEGGVYARVACVAMPRYPLTRKWLEILLSCTKEGISATTQKF